MAPPLLEVKLKRPDRIYRPPDLVDGLVLVTSSSSMSYNSIRLTATGTIVIQPSSKNVGVIQSLYSSFKPILLLKKEIELANGGQLVKERQLSFPFEFSLDESKNDGNIFGVLHETYHGAYINIQYVVTVEILRAYLQKSLTASVEFIVEGRKGRTPRFSTEFMNFYITQDTQKHLLVPSIRSGGFKVVGRVATQCSISEPVTGELTVENSAAPIRSIEAQLFRLETFLLSDKMAMERTLVQATQIADGDVCRGLALPIYVILPRLLTCPVISAGSFSVEFELSIVVCFAVEGAQSPQMVASESLPLKLFRT